MSKKTQTQEGVMILLVIISVGSVILGAFQKDMVLITEGVAVILLDLVLVLDYDKRRKLEKVE